MILPSGLLAATSKTPRSNATRRASLRPRSPPRPSITTKENARTFASKSSNQEPTLRRSSSLLLPSNEAISLDVALQSNSSPKSSEMHSSLFEHNENTLKYPQSSSNPKPMNENGTAWHSRLRLQCMKHGILVIDASQIYCMLLIAFFKLF